ncbi:MAG: hypothetical protein ACRDPT_15860 [Streptomycetales bacterium]
MQVGSYLLGVRSETPELDRLVVRSLAGHVVEGVQAPPNYALRLGHQHVLRASCQPLVRTRSLHRLLRALHALLADHAAEQDTTAVRVETLVLIRDGAALLLPPALRPLLCVEDELRRRGFRILDGCVATLEMADGELVVAPPVMPVDYATLARAQALAPEPAVPPPTAEPGRYPVRFWVTTTEGQGVEGHARVAVPHRGVLVAQANERVRNREAVGAQAALSTLARATSGAHPLAISPARHTHAVLDQLVELLDRHR